MTEVASEGAVAYEVQASAYEVASFEVICSEVASGKEVAEVGDPESQPGQGLLSIAPKRAC